MIAVTKNNLRNAFIGSQTQIEEKAKSKEKATTPWQVILYDDPVNIMNYVTLCIQKTLGYSHEKAVNIMLTVHYEGKAVAWSGNKEKAEMYVAKFQAQQLTASLESQ